MTSTGRLDCSRAFRSKAHAIEYLHSDVWFEEVG